MTIIYTATFGLPILYGAECPKVAEGKCEYRLQDGNVLCGKAEVGREPGNGKLPLKTFRLVGANITKHLTAGIRSKPEVQNFSLNVSNVL